MREFIKQGLQKEFNLGFNVVKNENEYIIRFNDSEKDSFYIDLIEKDDLRLTIKIQPEEYGANFLRNINLSSENQRRVFVDYWNAIGNDKVVLRINDIPIQPEDFINDQEIWKKFEIKYTKIPYFNEDEDKNNVILKTLIDLIYMVFSILDYKIENMDNDDNDEFKFYEEGEKYSIVTSKYERNPINRKLCLLVKGYKCAVCGFDFEEKYGAIGKNYIEVHHIIPVSSYGKSVEIDPIKDLVPLCSNCHSMVHRRTPPYTIEDLKNMINSGSESYE